jgi:hypothetical protein
VKTRSILNEQVQNSTDPKTGRGKSNLPKAVAGRPDLDKCATDAECWTHRRHARRVYEISQTFKTVFGAAALNDRVRMVYASWTIQEQGYVCECRTVSKGVVL